MNGQGRGCVPADHPLAFSRARSKALKEADLVIVVGTPMDFRLGFGQFAPGAKVVHIDTDPAEHVELAERMEGPVNLSLEGINECRRRQAADG